MVERRSNILLEIKDKNLIKWPERMKKSLFPREKTKYWRFHRDHGHDTDDYRILKDEIEFLIKKRHLEQYMRPKCNARPHEEHQIVEGNYPENPEQAE